MKIVKIPNTTTRAR